MFRALDRWLPAYLLRTRRRPAATPELPCHVFIAVCDHFEPFHHTDKAGALRAMDDWDAAWPAMVDSFRDSSGRGPRHTFFYPIEQYDGDVIERLASLCERTGSEVEVHLHHADDTAATVTEKLRSGINHLAGHGVFSRAADGTPRYAFIHGNWALDHSHPGGLHCGVPDELSVLKATGCYADLTFPSAPDPSQPPIINSIYHAREDGLSCSHHRGVKADSSGKTRALADTPDHLLMVQGPLGFNWRRRKFGLLPRLENGDLTGANPPTLGRFRLWQKLCPYVQHGPPWIFVKLHTHAGIPRNYRTLLGDPARQFHTALAAEAKRTPTLRYHYVTAREMVNLIHAAEGGAAMDADPVKFLEQTLSPPPRSKERGLQSAAHRQP
ncbi:MAG: hypothetical protein ACO1TE_15525 [Prosthecobacter sp.]